MNEDKLLKFIELAQQDTITPKELEQFILLVLNVIKESKDKFEQMSREGIQKIQEALSYMEREHETHEEEMSSEMKEMMSKCEGMCKEALAKMDKATKMVEDIKPIPPPPLETIAYEASKLVENKLTPLLPKTEDIVNDVLKEMDSGPLSISSIVGLEQKLREIEAKKAVSMPARRVYQPRIDRLTAQTDGNTKTFYLTREPIDTDTIEVSGTDFPIILDPTVDFTVSGKTLTLTSAVPAPTAGATLICKYYS